MTQSKKYPEYLYSELLGDFLIAMLRSIRSEHEESYRVAAESALGSWLRVREENGDRTLREAIDDAIERIGFRKSQMDKRDERLSAIARASITYLIEAGSAGDLGSGLLTRRTRELERQIEAFNEWREDRRRKSNAL